jgi:hypothetical protein
MKSKLFSCSVVFLLFLVLGVGGARADTFADKVGPQSPMGQSFTYQGQLKDSSGSPINDSCGFRFKLYDAETSGSQVGPNQEKTGISVEDGYFMVVLDFGSSAFLGEARWMEVAVKCSGDADFTILAPRQALTAAPYALDADLIDGQHATAFSTAGHNHWGETWTGTDTGLILTGGSRGLLSTGSSWGVVGSSDALNGNGLYGLATSTTGSTRGTVGESSSDSGVGVYGYASSSTGSTNGVIGYSESDSGIGVSGIVNSTSGGTCGVFGRSDSTVGKGLYGYAGATSGSNYGVYGESYSTLGTGVFGLAIGTTGVTNGVSGRTESIDGRGVYGLANSVSGLNFGVYGVSNSTTGMGVYGETNATTGSTYGVYGISTSTSGTGVTGQATSSSGYTFGVYGKTDSNNGTGVLGYSSTATGTGTGVEGHTDSISGYGVFGLADNNSGINSTGVYGRGDGNDSFGVAGHAYYSGVGVGAWSYGGNLIEAFSGDFPNGTLQFYISGAGDVFANGNYYTFSNSSMDSETHATSSIQSAEAWIEDFGRGNLVNGIAVITIAPDFAGVANLSVDYMVFVTLEGDCQGVYITNKTPATFEVHELNGGASNVPFGYRIVAKQAGAESVRLPVVTLPASVDTERQPDESAQPLQPPQLPPAPTTQEQVQNPN